MRWEYRLGEDGFTRDSFFPVQSLGEAHGIRFICPKSYAKWGGRPGAHQVAVYFVGSPVPGHIGHNKDGQTVRWSVSGTGLADLSLQPSIQEQDDHCQWHGYVTNGDAA